MSTYPKIAGYQGTFAGVPVEINPQSDYGWVSQQIVVGGEDVTYFQVPGVTIPVPAGAALSIPGPVGQFAVSGTAGKTYYVYSAAKAGSFDLFIAGSGGGGGGGAPTTAPYVLDAATVGTLTNAVPLQALATALEMIKEAALADDVVTPLQLKNSHISTVPTVDGGVYLPFSQINNQGEQQLGGIGAVWKSVPSPSTPQSKLVLNTETADVLEVSAESGPETLVTSPSRTLHFSSGTPNLKLTGGTKTLTLQGLANLLAFDGVKLVNIADGASLNDAASVGQAKLRSLYFAADGVPGGTGSIYGGPGAVVFCQQGCINTADGSGSNNILFKFLFSLPAGATVTQMVVSPFVNTLTTGDVTFYIYSAQGGGGPWPATPMTVLIDNTCPPNAEYSSVGNTFVTNAGDFFAVMAVSGGTLTITDFLSCSVRLDYLMP